MDETISYGALCLIPVTCVLIAAIITKRSIGPLLLGSAIGWIIISGKDFLWNLGESAVNQAGNYDTMWIVVVCALFGSIIGVMQRSGGATAFGDYIASKVESEKGTLLAAWFMGVVIFVDDYLNCLVVGSTMRKITDKHKIPRAALAYIVDATAAPVCILIPITTWAVYVAGLIERNGFAAAGEGMKLYISVIPYAFYPIVALILTFLFSSKILPPIGPMKTAYKKTQETGNTTAGSSSMKYADIEPSNDIKMSMIDFFVPMAVLVGVTIIYDIDLLRGVVATSIVCLLLYVPRKKMSLMEFLDAYFEGGINMVAPLMLVVAAFMLLEVNDTLGLTPFVINGLTPYMNGILFAAVVFFVQAMLGFFTGSNWGTWAITMPIVLPLADAAGVPISLALGALLSGGGFGSHACAWGDATVLASAGAGIDNLEHVKTQLPYCFLGGAIALIGYIIISIFMI